MKYLAAVIYRVVKKKVSYFFNGACTACLAILLFPGAAGAQNTYKLNGYMGVQGGESFNYDVILRDSVGSWLSGYSYTYKTSGNAVKTYIVAQVNREKKELHLWERAIVYNHGFQSRAVICLVDALLSYDKTEGVLKGQLITRTANNGRACSSGSISFIHPKQIGSLFEPSLPKVEQQPQAVATSVKTDPTAKLHAYFAAQKRAESQQHVRHPDAPQQPSSSARPIATPSPVKQITEGKDGVYRWMSDKIVFTIWDGSDEDGDRVAIYYNGEKVVANYTLKNAPYKLVLDVGGNEVNILSIVALNEGGKAPNTANILLQDGDKKYQVVAHNTIGKKAVLIFRKK